MVKVLVGKIKTIDYDEKNDILFISKDEKVKTSIDIGNFILDVNSRNLITGIEIMDASENLGIKEKVLKNIKNIKMSVTYKTNHVYMLLIMTFKKKGREVNIPIPLTLGLGHKTPKKEMLVYN